MTTFAPAQNAFSSGEISPLLWGRPDYQRYQTGLRFCNGYLPLRQGGFTRAPGTTYRGTTLDNAAGRLIGFEFAVNDALQLEFTPGKMRIWRYGALVEDSGDPGNAYELDTPYDAAAIERLQWVQSADVIYLADGVLPIQRLARFALDNWTIGDFEARNGPFLVQNIDTALTIQASAQTGTITLTASAALFTAEMVGSLFQLKPDGYPDIALWTGNTPVSGTDMMRYDGNIYQRVGGSNTGATPPVHTEGIELVDLDKNMKWEFISDGVGVVEITAFTSSTEVTAEVRKRVPPPCVSAATYRWAEGAWSPKNGYPACIAIYDQRLVAAATPAEPRTLWFSAVGIFDDFAPGVEATDSFAYTVAGTESLNAVQWIARGKKGLHVGCLGEILSARSDSQGQVIGPTTFVLAPDASVGAMPSLPISPDGKPIFIAKDGQRVFEVEYSFEQDANKQVELSLPSEHLGAVGFAQIVWQSAVQRLSWLRRNDGTLAALLHDPDEKVLGWAPCSLAAGFCESLCVSPDPASGQDKLHMIVRRVIDGATVRMVEEQPLTYGVLNGSQPISEAQHFFAASIFVPGSPSDTFSVPHLVGETVSVWTDKGDLGTYEVPEGGEITLDDVVSRATIGLFDATHLAETLNPRAPAPDGDTLGRKIRLKPAGGVMLHRTAQGRVRAVERSIEDGEYAHDEMDLIALPVAAALDTAYSGVSELQALTGLSQDVSLRFTPVSGAPMTVLGLTPTIEEAGA